MAKDPQIRETFNARFGTVTAETNKRHLFFSLFVIVSVIVFRNTLYELALYSWRNESCSHIFLVPLVSLFLLYSERKDVFSETRYSFLSGAAIIASGMSLYWWLANGHVQWRDESQILSAMTLCVVVTWIGGFLTVYGRRAARVGVFALLFLLLMIPLPEAVLAKVILLLQRGSAEIAYFLIKTVGVPVFRQGFLLSVPGLTVEVAAECSGIRSSMALFITCLLAARFFLRTAWGMLVFVAVALPFAVIKNGIRIATLTLLSLYVSPKFMVGSLHRDGGFVFFLLALAVLWPLLAILQRLETEARKLGAEVPPSTGVQLRHQE